MLEQERRFYTIHAGDWEKSHPGKFVVVKGEALVGYFDSLDEALAAGASRFGLTSFLVRQVGANVEAVQIPALTLGLLRADH
jgi:hypothetical protein